GGGWARVRLDDPVAPRGPARALRFATSSQCRSHDDGFCPVKSRRFRRWHAQCCSAPMERIMWLLLIVCYGAGVWRLYADGWGRPDVVVQATSSRHVMRVVAGGRPGGVSRPAPAPEKTEERIHSWS